MLHISSNATTDVNIGPEDFNSYTGTMWNSETNPTSGVLPTISGVSSKFTPGFTPYSGITAGKAVDVDADYGTSVMIVEDYDVAATKATYAYWDFKDGTALPIPTGSVYMEFSMNVGKSSSGVYMDRSLRINGATSVYPVGMSANQTFSVFGSSTSVSWSPDTWYDMKIWYNLDTGAYRVQIYDGPTAIVDKSGLTDAVKNINRILFYYAAKATQNAGKQTTYYDNFKLQNIYKFTIDESASLDYFNFDEWDSSTGLPDTLGKGMWLKGLSGKGTHPVEQIRTDRGYSMKISSSVTDGTTNNNHTNPAVYFNYGSKIKTAVAFKTSFMFKDNNFVNVQLKMSNSVIAIQALSAASITTFDGIDTGMDVKLNTWYDLDCVFDVDTGYYTIYLTDGTQEYRGHGFSAEAIKAGEASYYRTWFRINGQWDNDYSKATSLVIDDFYYGAVSKVAAPLYVNYDFSDGEIPENFTTTGGSAAISNGELLVIGTTTAETVSSMKLPFKNTTFRYKTEINIADLLCDRVLFASTSNDSVEVVKLASDGKLYIGGTAAADISIGTYSAEIIFDQSKYTAAVTILKNGTVVGYGNVSLGTKAVTLIYLDWKIGEAANTKTSLDNVEFRGIYSFQLDNKNSTTGADKVIKLSDSVVAKFTNAVDKTSFTTNSVKVNGGEIVPLILFPDDNTVKFNFEKLPGEKYRVGFSNAKDLFGNTLTDYIEFSVASAENLYLSGIRFTKNGNPIEITESGTITASFDAAAYKDDVDILYMLGLYEGGRLINSNYSSFTVKSEIQPYSLDISIPNDDKHYILKAFIWDSNTFKPYSDAAVLKATNLPIVILKLDGIGVARRLTAFEPSFDYAVDNNVKMNFGLIVRDADSAAYPDDVERLKEMESNTLIEFWNHQYGSGNYGGYTTEEIYEDFENAKNTFEKTGMNVSTFNSIENYIGPEVVGALNAYNYKAVLSRASEDRLANMGYLDKDNTFTTLWKTFDVEKAASGTTQKGTSVSNVTVCRPVEELVDFWKFAKVDDWGYVVLQYHPVNWPDSDLTTSDGKVYSSDYMNDFIEYLSDDGVIFMHSTEYVDYASVLNSK